MSSIHKGRKRGPLRPAVHSTRARRFWLAVAAAAVTVVAIVGTAAGAGTWTTLASVPAGVGPGTEGMQVAVVGDQIIAAYGYSFGDSNLTRIYHIDTDSWSAGALAPLPVRSEGAAVDHGGFFYAVGGRPSLKDLDRYDPATNSWVSLADMSTGRGGLGAAVVGNAIYAIGGRTSGSPCSGGALASVERYDIDTNTWSAVAPLPSARSDLAAVTHGGKIYVFGGCTGFFTVVNDVDVYDPVTDTWSTAPANLPTVRASMYGAAAKGGTVYVIGGWSGVQLTTNEAYDVAADTWSTEVPMPSARAEMGVVSHGGRIYTVGGGFFGASSNLNLSFKPKP